MYLDTDSTADIEITVTWTSGEANHIEHFHTDKVNCWRDIFPEKVMNIIMGGKEGEEFNFSSGQGVKLGLLLLGTLRQVMQLDDGQSEGKKK